MLKSSLIHRFGVCEPYNGDMALCNRVLRPGVDYVFIASTHGTQRNVTLFLEKNIPSYLEHRSLTDDTSCYDNILRIICNYYMSPCGNDSSKLPPHAICPDDCYTVQQSCPAAWETAQHGLEKYKFISCNWSSLFIFPLPSCCTSVGLQKVMHAHEISTVGKVVGGIVAAVVTVCVIVITATLIYCFVKWRTKQKRVQRLHSDIIAT